MPNEELRDMCAGANIIFVICILLCVIYKIYTYNTYNGDSLHNNFPKKQKRFSTINICLLAVDASYFELYIGHSSGVQEY
jgi:hypothetical protein